MEVEKFVRLSNYSPGRIEFALADGAPAELPSSLSRKLETWTGARWGVSIVSDCDMMTISERQNKERLEAHTEAEISPIVTKFRSFFPNAEIIDITRAEGAVEEEVIADGGWDPIDFDDLG